MKRHWPLLLLGLSLGLNIGLLIRQPRATATLTSNEAIGPGSSRPAGRGGVQRIADELGLEGEVRDRFITLKAESFRQSAAERRRIADLQRQLQLELKRERVDRERVDELLDQLATAHGALERTFVDSFLASCELLDPEQRRRYQQRFAGPAAQGGRNRGNNQRRRSLARPGPAGGPP